MTRKLKHTLLVFDTDTYAGNFERPCCAWVTGQVGECGVGEEIRDLAWEEMSEALQEFGEDGSIESVADDHGCHRPVTLWPTPGFFNDGHGNNWPDTKKGSEEVRAKYEKVVTDYKRNAYKSYAPQHHEKVKEQSEKELADALERGPGSFPSYQSVGIYLAEEPPPEILAEMVARGFRFFQPWSESMRETRGAKFTEPKNVTLLGVRLVKVYEIEEYTTLEMSL
jgi:hypothetical protein